VAGEPDKRNRPEWPGHYFRPSIRSAGCPRRTLGSPEERRRAHGVRDAGSAFRAPDRTRELAAAGVRNSIN